MCVDFRTARISSRSMAPENAEITRDFRISPDGSTRKLVTTTPPTCCSFSDPIAPPSVIVSTPEIDLHVKQVPPVLADLPEDALSARLASAAGARP